MEQKKTYHALHRDDGSISVYYTIDGDPAHYVVYDTLDAPAGLPELQAENERLRAALEQIAAGNPAPPGGKWLSDAKMAMIARAALKAEEGVHPENFLSVVEGRSRRGE